MKKFLASALVALSPALVLAQTAAKPAAAPAPAAKPAPKAAPKKAAPSPSRTEIKSTANQMATGMMAAEAALSPEEVALGERVHVGRVPCELGAFVTVEADPKSPGYFNVETRGLKYRMFPVLSRTGAIRLEDQRTGAIWLQLANKSMLMDQRAGKRLADECMSPDQAAVAQALKVNPAPSLLDAPPAARAASAAASATQPSVVVQPAGMPSAPSAAAVVPLPPASAPAGAASAPQ